jgi:hypothetical protein
MCGPAWAAGGLIPARECGPSGGYRSSILRATGLRAPRNPAAASTGARPQRPSAASGHPSPRDRVGCTHQAGRASGAVGGRAPPDARRTWVRAPTRRLPRPPMPRLGATRKPFRRGGWSGPSVGEARSAHGASRGAAQASAPKCRDAVCPLRVCPLACARRQMRGGPGSRSSPGPDAPCRAPRHSDAACHHATRPTRMLTPMTRMRKIGGLNPKCQDAVCPLRVVSGLVTRTLPSLRALARPSARDPRHPTDSDARADDSDRLGSAARTTTTRIDRPHHA